MRPEEVISQVIGTLERAIEPADESADDVVRSCYEQLTAWEEQAQRQGGEAAPVSNDKALPTWDSVNPKIDALKYTGGFWEAVGGPMHGFTLFHLGWPEPESGEGTVVRRPQPAVPEGHRAIIGSETGEQIGCTRGDGADVEAEEPGALLVEQDIKECPICNPSSAHQPQPDWIACSERLPTADDRDDCHKVWGFDKRKDKVDHVWWDLLSLEEYTHWKPTGLKRPEPPEDVNAS